MTINNVTEFYNLINSKGLGGDPTFKGLISCMDDYKAKCICNDASAKNNVYMQCVNAYISIASGQIGNYLARIGSGTFTFNEKGQHIATYKT